MESYWRNHPHHPLLGGVGVGQSEAGDNSPIGGYLFSAQGLTHPALRAPLLGGEGLPQAAILSSMLASNGGLSGTEPKPRCFANTLARCFRWR